MFFCLPVHAKTCPIHNFYIYDGILLNKCIPTCGNVLHTTFRLIGQQSRLQGQIKFLLEAGHIWFETFLVIFDRDLTKNILICLHAQNLPIYCNVPQTVLVLCPLDSHLARPKSINWICPVIHKKWNFC